MTCLNMLWSPHADTPVAAPTATTFLKVEDEKEYCYIAQRLGINYIRLAWRYQGRFYYLPRLLSSGLASYSSVSYSVFIQDTQFRSSV